MTVYKQFWLILAGFAVLMSGMWTSASAAGDSQDSFAQLEQRARDGDVEAQADLGAALPWVKGWQRIMWSREVGC